MDTYIYIVEDFLFFCSGIILLYFFALAVCSHFRHVQYPAAQRQYRCVVLVSASSVLPHPKEGSHDIVVYKDLKETINSLNEDLYDIVILLSDNATSLSPLFIEKIGNAYDDGVKAMQLHSIITNHNRFSKYFSSLSNEIENSLFRIANTQMGFSSALFGTNIAVDLKWLKGNLKSNKTNLERKLLKQHIYIEYLPDAIVYCESTPAYPYRKRIGKALSALLPAMIERHWSLFNRMIQQILPSPRNLYILAIICSLSLTAYDWSLSIKWWILLFGLTVTFSLAIPDYLIKEKKKYSIWRKTH